MTAGPWVAAEGKQRMPGGGIRGGTGWVSPAGRLHAVDADDVLTMCGKSLGGLFEFREVPWDGLKAGVRCPDCLRETSTG